jgi:DNA-directed RNA polymerase subunit RPC12/RpoP
MADELSIRCPHCHSDAFYRYGKTANGEPRFRCLICGRQFTINSKPDLLSNRPTCPKCGKPMHIYAYGVDYVRFRCSNYPNCMTYVKMFKKYLE